LESIKRIQAQALNTLIRSIFTAAGSQAGEAEAIADHLVDSNLAGHDSHGVIRVRKYIEWARAGVSDGACTSKPRQPIVWN
jgi:uncharacterized oxidoreductase